MSATSSVESLLVEDRVRGYIRLGESHFREFKSAVISTPGGPRTARNPKDVCRDIAETLVAFANADGGDLIVGVEDDGTITGVPHAPDAVELMKKAPSSHTHPETQLPPVATFELQIEGATLLYYRVQKNEERVCLTSSGRCLKRFDRQNTPTSAEHIQYDRQELKSKQYDREFIRGATLQDLNDAQIEAASLKLAPGFSAERFLQLFDLADFTPQGLALKRAALLLFAASIVNWHPRCQVRLVRVEGTTLGSGDAIMSYKMNQSGAIS